MFASTAAIGAMLSAPFPVLADEAAGSRYQDPVDSWSMAIPSDWELGFGEAEGSSATRRVVAFFPKSSDEFKDINVTVVCTNIAADFTKMGSFGSPFEFGTRLVGTLDRSFVGKKPKILGGNGKGDGTGQIATLINTSSSNDMYNIEYNIEQPNEFNRRLYQVVGLSYNGMYNRLYTVTAQVPVEKSSEDVKKVLTSMLGSFEMPASK